MAHFVRLIALICACWSGFAAAAIPASYRWYVPGFTAPEVTPDTACQLARPGQFAAPSVFRTNPAAPGGSDYVCNDAGGSTVATAIRYDYPAGGTCPPNSTSAGSTCTCSTGYTEQAGACVVPPEPGDAHCNSIVGSQVKTSWTSTAPSLATRNVCASGGSGYHCNATIEPDFCGSSDGGSYVCYGSGVSASGACTPSSTPEQPVPPTSPVSELPSPPPPGTCPGEVNGVTVNVPCSRTETKTTKGTTETDGAGNTTAKSESKSTTCTAAGSCTTTVTTTTTVNGGSPTSTSKTTTQTKGDFCAENAGAKECGDGDGSAFGGSCEAGFQCEGDAVQCALAKEVHTQNCKLNKVTDESTLYGAEKDLQGSQTEDLPGNETIPFGASSYDDSDAIGGAACVSDLSVEVFAQSITLPLSGVCSYLVWIRNALLALGSLAWLLIVFRR